MIMTQHLVDHIFEIATHRQMHELKARFYENELEAYKQSPESGLRELTKDNLTDFLLDHGDVLPIVQEIILGEDIVYSLNEVDVIVIAERYDLKEEHYDACINYVRRNMEIEDWEKSMSFYVESFMRGAE